MIGNRSAEPYEVFNVGTGRGVSVLELVHRFEEVNHLKLNYRIAPRREGDIVAIWADPDPLRTRSWAGGPSARSTRRSLRPGSGRSACAASSSGFPDFPSRSFGGRGRQYGAGRNFTSKFRPAFVVCGAWTLPAAAFREAGHGRFRSPELASSTLHSPP